MSLGRLRVITSGESHGPQLTIIVENLPAAGVVGEAMVAIVVADAMRVKFGGDSLAEALTNFRSYLATSG